MCHLLVGRVNFIGNYAGRKRNFIRRKGENPYEIPDETGVKCRFRRMRAGLRVLLLRFRAESITLEPAKRKELTHMARWMRNNNTTYVNYPEYSEKYLVIDGQIYVNIAAEPGSQIIGRFLRGADEGANKRGR